MAVEIYVFIYLPGDVAAVPAGLFTYDERARIGRFEYGRRYLQRADAVAVDPVALPLSPAARECHESNRGLFGALRDALPDYWGRLVIAAQERVAVEALSEADLMLQPSATRSGNLDFRTSPDAQEPALGPLDFADLADLLAAADHIQAGEPVSVHLARLLAEGTTLGGARPKCTVRWNGELWIAKFPARNEDLNVPRLEYATLRLAQRCGIRVPDVHIVSVGGRDVLLVKRFDRVVMAGGMSRFGYLSALSLLQRDEHERIGYPGLAEGMRRHGMHGPRNQPELFRRMVFNVLIRNTDDHARNHGFLFDGTRLQLSPAFDLVPAPARPGIGTEFDLALELGTQGRLATLDNALSRAASFGLGDDAARETVKSLSGVVSRWREHFQADGLDGNTLEKIQYSFMKPD